MICSFYYYVLYYSFFVFFFFLGNGTSKRIVRQQKRENITFSDLKSVQIRAYRRCYARTESTCCADFIMKYYIMELYALIKYLYCIMCPWTMKAFFAYFVEYTMKANKINKCIRVSWIINFWNILYECQPSNIEQTMYFNVFRIKCTYFVSNSIYRCELWAVNLCTLLLFLIFIWLARWSHVYEMEICMKDNSIIEEIIIYCTMREFIKSIKFVFLLSRNGN